jgi:hypothetical protein
MITFFWPKKPFAVLGSFPVSIGHLGSQSDWTTLPSEDFLCSSLNTWGSTWGKIFQHLLILLGFGCHGLLAWATCSRGERSKVVELTLHSFVGVISQPIPWKRAPEFRNKIILFGPGKCIVAEENAISGLADLRANHMHLLPVNLSS